MVTSECGMVGIGLRSAKRRGSPVPEIDQVREGVLGRTGSQTTASMWVGTGYWCGGSGHVDRAAAVSCRGCLMVEDIERPAGLLFVWPRGHTTKTRLLREQSEGRGRGEPRKSPAVLIELSFLLSNTHGQIWLLLSRVSMASFVCLFIFEVSLLCSPGWPGAHHIP